MATVSFNVNAPKTAPETAPAVVYPQTPAVSIPSASGIEGEVSSRDLRPPRLSLVQKVGNLADSFTPGSFVYNKDVLLADPKDDLSVTILRFKAYYQQKLPYGTEAMPLRFDTAEEVRANGGSLTYGAESYYDKCADIMMAIELPKGASEETEAFFCNEVGGRFYALALYSATATAYGSIGVKIVTDASMVLKDGIWRGKYTLGRLLKKSPKNSYYVPTLKFDGRLSEDEAAAMYALSGR